MNLPFFSDDISARIVDDLMSKLALMIQESSNEPQELFGKLAVNLPPVIRSLAHSWFMIGFQAGTLADGVDTGPIKPDRIIIKGNYAGGAGRATNLEDILVGANDFTEEYQSGKIRSIEIVIIPKE